MTDEQQQDTDNNIDQPDAPDNEPVSGLSHDDVDVEGALAAIASLQDLTREEEAAVEFDDDGDEDLGDDDVIEIAPFERVEPGPEPASESVFDDTPGDRPEPVIHTQADTSFPRPPLSVLHRGQLASVVPALLLIGFGGYLTFVVTTTGLSLPPGVIVAILMASVGAILLARWLSTARWAIGNFFIGVLLLATGATATYLLLPNNLSLVDGYPLLLTAVGMSFVITDVVMPTGRRAWLFGLILAIIGIVGVITTTMLLEMQSAEWLSRLWPVPLVILGLMFLAPFISRRRS